jgi:UDPglucose 6-dehydrogenase
MGQRVVGIEFDAEAIDRLSQGKAPLYEPDLEETIQSGLSGGNVLFSTDPAHLSRCDFVFLAYDTPVDENDLYDLSPLEKALDQIAPHLKASAIFIVSSQVPAGTCRQFQKKMNNPVVYSPENLRLGEAIFNYLNPGHVVIGADSEEASAAVSALFSSIPASYMKMDLASAEMTKHAINSFLASSVTFANQLSDACSLCGADFNQVASAMKQDPRIGKKAYLKAGIGFSGGTLGRDLQILNGLNKSKGGGSFPLFGEIWQYNRQRPRSIVYKIGRILHQFKDKSIGLLGLTYKPGTSTLRRSIPLEIAYDLARKGANVSAYDPKANLSEANLEGIQIQPDPYSVSLDAHFLLLLTEWPEFKDLDFGRLGHPMKEKRLFDPYSFLSARYGEIQSAGFQIFNNIIVK